MRSRIKIQLYLFLSIGIMFILTNSCKDEEEEPIIKVTPVITWANPLDVKAGTLLSATQLNATSAVEGRFVYTPSLGTKLTGGRLPGGIIMALNVVFIPTDIAKYNTISKTVNINVVSITIPTENVNIPAGTFIMGSPLSELGTRIIDTLHIVTLSSYSMSKYEITNAQFAVFLNALTDNSYDQTFVYGSLDWGLIYDLKNNIWAPSAGYDNHPVGGVTWYGASAFAAYVGGTLPSEAQWEYACRAGTSTPFNTGSCLTNNDANYNWELPYDNCVNNIAHFGKTQAVGTYAPNGYGLYDMHGNVSEWCSDWYSFYHPFAQTNPIGNTEGAFRVYRGGSWNESAQNCRSAKRGTLEPGLSKGDLGFRVVFAN